MTELDLLGRCCWHRVKDYLFILSFRMRHVWASLAGKAGNILTSELGSLIILLSYGYTAMKYEVSPLAVEMMRWLIDHCAEPGYTAMKWKKGGRNEKGSFVSFRLRHDWGIFWRRRGLIDYCAGPWVHCNQVWRFLLSSKWQNWLEGA